MQEAIALVFGKFDELQTVRQVHLWMRQKRLPLPAVIYGDGGRQIIWKLPVYNTLHHMLTNPVYAGAYVFGRTGSRTTIEAGRKRIVRGFRKERAAWEVLILDHHEGYIGWTDFERNQRLISDRNRYKILRMLPGGQLRSRLQSQRKAAVAIHCLSHAAGSVTLRARVGWPGERPTNYYPTRVENGAMRCIECDAADVSERRERTTRGYRRFRCRACGKQFNERSGGILNRAQYPSDVIALVIFWRLR